MVTYCRNWLYDHQWLKTTHFPIRVISVGNLTVGGTGKTPMVEYLIRLLKDHHPIATLSRGYGRKTKGFIIADTTATAKTIGDEPLQFYQKFGHIITVAVGEDRVGASQKLLEQNPDIQTIILDDAYQHRAIGRDVNVLLIDYSRPIDQDFLLPAGQLREDRIGAARADCVVITKCPQDLSAKEQVQRKQNLSKYIKPDTPILFAGIRYGAIITTQNYRLDTPLGFSSLAILLVTGIAQTALLVKYASSKYSIYKHLLFKDHHLYTQEDWKYIVSIFQEIPHENKIILTTEKDFVKLESFATTEIPLFYLPIELYFLNNNEQEIFRNLFVIPA